jgi:hypothetical protein
MDSLGRIAMDRNGFEFCPVAGKRRKRNMDRERLKPATHRHIDPYEARKAVAQAFDCLGEANPLRAMAEADKAVVWGTLGLFADERSAPSRYEQQWDRLAQVAADAAKLASRIEEILQADHGEVLNRRLKNSRDLPTHLSSFADQAGGLVKTLGETDLKRRRALQDRFLIYASEFVKLKTGTWNDEHLAELLQTMRSVSADFSGDAIRKTRERFRQKHHVLYEITLKTISEDQDKRKQMRVRPGSSRSSSL